MVCVGFSISIRKLIVHATKSHSESLKIVYSLRSSECIFNPEIYFSIIKKENEECLRQMNKSLFLVLYDDNYYDALFSSELSYSLLIHSDEESIGTVSFKVQESDAYLYTFGLLPHLRGLGLGSLVLAHLECYIKSQFDISTLSLHVHSSNERALTFYQRNGFKIRLMLPDYYAGVHPASAYFMVKDMSPHKRHDHLL